jgi:hypothetical protein
MARGKPFARGASGNPAGKPQGARHKTPLAVEALLDGEAEELTRKAIELAKAGDMRAIWLRFVSAWRESHRPERIDRFRSLSGRSPLSLTSPMRWRILSALSPMAC